jgi:SAM-dependent methyltransferase
MLRPDIIDLREFYANPLGRAVRRLLRQRMRDFWPDVHGLTVLGLGYATPYLRIFEGEAERVLAAMPGPQGVVRWPRGLPGRVTLVDEDDLPLPDASVDRLLLMHALENSENTRLLLREVWRVLTPQGRLLAVVPNRRGLWAHIEATPFGQGHPYTPPQLMRLMRDSMFSPTASQQALWLPPSDGAVVIKAVNAWEKAGEILWKRFSGVLLVEAEKQVYAGAPVKAVKTKRHFLLKPAAQPALTSGAHRAEKTKAD